MELTAHDALRLYIGAESNAGQNNLAQRVATV
jgi:hypothetical protein